MNTKGNTDPNAALALARYLGDEFEAHQRPSGIWGTRRVPLSVTPDFGATKVEPCRETYCKTMWYRHFNGVPQGSPVPY